jgi:hypothetical protein
MCRVDVPMSRHIVMVESCISLWIVESKKPQTSSEPSTDRDTNVEPKKCECAKCNETIVRPDPVQPHVTHLFSAESRDVKTPSPTLSCTSARTPSPPSPTHSHLFLFVLALHPFPQVLSTLMFIPPLALVLTPRPHHQNSIKHNSNHNRHNSAHGLIRGIVQ